MQTLCTSPSAFRQRIKCVLDLCMDLIHNGSCIRLCVKYRVPPCGFHIHVVSELLKNY